MLLYKEILGNEVVCFISFCLTNGERISFELFDPSLDSASIILERIMTESGSRPDVPFDLGLHLEISAVEGVDDDSNDLVATSSSVRVVAVVAALRIGLAE